MLTTFWEEEEEEVVDVVVDQTKEEGESRTFSPLLIES